MSYVPAVGDVVSTPNGDVGEVVELQSVSVGVRIVQEESQWRGQTVYFVPAQLAPVNLGR